VQQTIQQLRNAGDDGEDNGDHFEATTTGSEQMTSAELYTLIQSDPQALAAYNASDDGRMCGTVHGDCTTDHAGSRGKSVAAVAGESRAAGGRRRIGENTSAAKPPYNACQRC
jgi:hypothetical protein